MIEYEDRERKSGNFPREMVQKGNLETEVEQEGEIWAKEEKKRVKRDR